MDQRFRRGFTAAEKTALWDRWQRGESLKAIGRTFGKPSSSIYCQLAPRCCVDRLRPPPISDIRPATSDNCDAAYADGNLPPHYELGALIE
jgi:hypothetical protein